MAWLLIGLIAQVFVHFHCPRPSAGIKPFYNADSITEGLGDADDAALQRASRKLVDERIEHDLGEGNTFGFEGTCSGRSRPDIVRTAHRFGYTTRAIFLGTGTAEINVRRVRKRASVHASPAATASESLDRLFDEPEGIGVLDQGPDLGTVEARQVPRRRPARHVVEGEHRVGLAAAEVGLKLDHRIAARA